CRKWSSWRRTCATGFRKLPSTSSTPMPRCSGWTTTRRCSHGSRAGWLWEAPWRCRFRRTSGRRATGCCAHSPIARVGRSAWMACSGRTRSTRRSSITVCCRAGGGGSTSGQPSTCRPSPVTTLCSNGCGGPPCAPCSTPSPARKPRSSSLPTPPPSGRRTRRRKTGRACSRFGGSSSSSAVYEPLVGVLLAPARRLATQVLRRPWMAGVADVDGGVEGPVGIHQVGAGDEAQVRPPGDYHRVDVVDRRHRPDGHRRKTGLEADPVRERRLPQPPVAGLLVLHHLAGGDVDDVDAVVRQHPGDLHGVVARRAPCRPVGGRDPHGQREVLGPHLPDSV